MFRISGLNSETQIYADKKTWCTSFFYAAFRVAHEMTQASLYLHVYHCALFGHVLYDLYRLEFRQFMNITSQ